MKDTFLYSLARYLYHRIRGKRSWRVFELCPTFYTFGGKTGYWIVTPRMTRRMAKSYSSFWGHIHFDPGPDDYGIKEPEYINDIHKLPEGSQDIGHYHWKYKSTLWGK